MHYFEVPNFWKKVSLRTHLIYFIRPEMMLESVSEHFANLRHENLSKTCVSALNALFRGTELLKKVLLRRYPMYSIRSKMSLGSVSEHFANLRQKKYANHVFQPRMHYFGVSNSRKKFRYERTQSTTLDSKRRLGVFQSILQTFGTKNYVKHVFQV